MSFWSALVCIVEGLDNLGLTNSGPGFFTAIQCQMESQLMADPEMMRCILGSSFVQSALSSSSPQLTRQLILSNPQIQQLLPTNPEVGDVLNNADVISQVGDEKGCVSLCLRCKCVSSACQSSVHVQKKAQITSYITWYIVIKDFSFRICLRIKICLWYELIKVIICKNSALKTPQNN